ncbi:alkaline phosphatase family protein [Flavobacterium sp.]|uniref:LTA synthase family protein n=1 Tax=Flavobacterium sp. TaxID=239 RepID=UPI002637E791|nr:alkaline phosphatase family protein [Flavobacterium sp.]MDD3005100.1 sulfatase-like hydrolase/transferase [Flavobacterium sp.]
MQIHFPKRYQLVFDFSIWFIIFSLIIRIVFVAWQFSEVNTSIINLLQTFLYGLFFDLGVLTFVALINSFYLLMIPKKLIGSNLDKILIYFFFTLTILIFVFTFFAEITFWDEFKCRFNFVAVDYLIYTFEVVNNINESYPLVYLVPSMLLITFAILFWFKKRNSFKETFSAKTPFKTRFIVSGSTFLLAGFYVFFVKNADAEWSENRYNSEISKAGIYSFFAELRNNKLDYETFYTTLPKEKAFAIVHAKLQHSNTQFGSDPASIYRTINDSLDNNQRPNVVFVLMESMSAKFMREFGNDKQITPFMDKLAQESLLFSNLYATGTRTVRGMEAVTLSIPPTPGSSIVKRQENANLFTIASVFKQKNYQCNFFYGGDGYFDNMNAYFGGNGFDIYDRGRGSILSDKIKTNRHNITDEEVTFENAWGVCDEDIYKKLIAVADKNYAEKKPFLNFVMTTSNHKPYTYPDKKVAIPSGTGRNGAVQYADFALKQLFEKAKTKPWFANTIFVVIADHCASSAGKDEIDVANYHIPALIYGPNIPPQKVQKLCSQIDVFPTLFGLLNWKYESNFYGQNVLDTHFEPRTFVGTYLKLGYMKNDSIMVLSNQKKNHFYKWNKLTNSLSKLPINNSFLNEAISMYQTADYLYKNKKLVDK